MIYDFNRVIHILHTQMRVGMGREFIVPWFICELCIFKFEYLCLCVRIITLDRLSNGVFAFIFARLTRFSIHSASLAFNHMRKVLQPNWRNLKQFAEKENDSFTGKPRKLQMMVKCITLWKNGYRRINQHHRQNHRAHSGWMDTYHACIIVLPKREMRKCWSNGKPQAPLLQLISYPIWIIFLFEWLRIYMFFSSLFHFRGFLFFFASLCSTLIAFLQFKSHSEFLWIHWNEVKHSGMTLIVFFFASCLFCLSLRRPFRHFEIALAFGFFPSSARSRAFPCFISRLQLVSFWESWWQSLSQMKIYVSCRLTRKVDISHRLKGADWKAF